MSIGHRSVTGGSNEGGPNRSAAAYTPSPATSSPATSARPRVPNRGRRAFWRNRLRTRTARIMRAIGIGRRRRVARISARCAANYRANGRAGSRFDNGRTVRASPHRRHGGGASGHRDARRRRAGNRVGRPNRIARADERSAADGRRDVATLPQPGTRATNGGERAPHAPAPSSTSQPRRAASRRCGTKSARFEPANRSFYSTNFRFLFPCSFLASNFLRARDATSNGSPWL